MYYHQIDKRIAIQEGMSEAQTVKTLIHEMAHQKLHALPEVEQEAIKSRNSKEVEAESVAYVVCQHFGINTSDYSFGYVAGWSNGKETSELKASLGEIRETAADMIGAINQALEKGLSTTIDAQAVKEIEIPEEKEKPAKKKSIRKKLETTREKVTKEPTKHRTKVKEAEASV